MATKLDPNYILRGRITNLQDEPLQGVIVRAYDQDPKTPENRLGQEATTDQDGHYAIHFTEADFKLGGKESGGPDVFIRVYDSENMLGESSVTRDAKNPIEINLRVDYVRIDSKESAREVHGSVRDVEGNLVADISVHAFDRDLRSEEPLGQNPTDPNGYYRIQYYSRKFRKQEKGSADLVIKAFGADGSWLITSPILYNAPSSAEVDLTIPAEKLIPPTLFEKIGRTIEPLVDDLKIADLEEDEDHQDLTFLAGETGFEKKDLARFALAHKPALPAIQAEFWFALFGGSFYQYSEGKSLKDQSITLLNFLPSMDAASVRKALIRSFNLREIPEGFHKNIDGWVETFLKFVATHLVKDSKKPTFVRSALDDAGIKDPKKQETFSRLFKEYGGFTPELLKTLNKKRFFKRGEIADLQTSFQLAQFTGSDFSLVKLLKTKFNIRQPEEIRTLAKKTEGEWVKLIKKAYKDGEIEIPIEVKELDGQSKFPRAEAYGEILGRQFRESFPTMAFAGGLERALKHGGAKGLGHAQTLNKFLDRHPNFELLNTSVDEFLKDNTHADFRAHARDDNFRLELKAVQRVFKLVPTFEATDRLLANDLHSAQKIYRMGESEFVRSYGDKPGFTKESAQLAWNRAANTYAAVVTIVSDLKSLEMESLPTALQSSSSAALSTFPNWNNLFKAGDLCECEDCRSVLSPAAYFTDLLMFLKDRKAKDPAYSVKDILFNRRPDLGYLELNCENALTQLPYVDVVCEVLEDVVAAGANAVELKGFTAVPAGTATTQKTAVKAALVAQNIRLDSDFSLSQVDSSNPDLWVVHGDDVTYLLKKKGSNPNFFAEILRNTKTNATELRAYPQYVNPEAYKKLKQAKYPLTLPLDLFTEGDARRVEQRERSLSLPFDLFAEDVRATFTKCNLQRCDLMRTFRGTTAPYNLTDGDIATEYFSISADPAAAFDEKRLILVADTTTSGQKVVWGESGANWLSTVGNVKNFLQKTGLEYTELLQLLDLKFINPTNDIVIQHLDPSCDTDQKVIQVLDATKLDRIHRFLRLWRKLKNWKMWELDLVIRHPQIGNGYLDETFLTNLFYFEQVRRKIDGKTTVEQACALFGNLNTQTHFTKPYEKREDSIYQSLFLNKKLMQPLDLAFQIDTNTGDLPTGETITAHHSVVLAALVIGEADILTLKGLIKSSADNLTLANLSFLWRHTWLAKVLKFKVEEWKNLPKILNQDISVFSNPKAAWEFLEKIDHLKVTGFTVDELNWLLAADQSAKAADKESDVSRFLTSLRKDLQTIQTEYDAAQYSFLTATPPTDVDKLSSLLTSLLQKLNRDEADTQFVIAILRDEVSQQAQIAGLPANFDFPKAIKDVIRIRYEKKSTTLYFIGLMTTAEKNTLLTDPSLATVTSIAAYQKAINEFYTRPRLALKFYEPIFHAPLAALPAAVDFKALPDPALEMKVSFDAEKHLLRFAGIMSDDEKGALDALSAATEVAYRNAVNSLYTQPDLVASPDPRIWMLDADLQFPLRDMSTPANDHLAINLATAVTKTLIYLSRTLSEGIVIQQCSAQLELTEALTRRILTGFAILPPIPPDTSNSTMLSHLIRVFAATLKVVDYATLPDTFKGWFWASRLATILKKWKVTTDDLEKMKALINGAQLLDFLTLPLDATGTIVSLDRFIRTNRLLRMRDSLPETKITLLEVLEKLNSPAGTGYTSLNFAKDVELLNESWNASDIDKLTQALNITYPANYLLAESWERLRRALYFLDNLNSGVDTVKKFAAVAMSDSEAKTLKELLRSKFGSETWLTLCTEIQDALRERKRDALAAYLLTQSMPTDAPSKKWENTNDLYAYYLLDVEMNSCQPTSRLVQGSGSVQLFVQRCFMGLEPDVVVKADGDDGDSAWQWWKWMRKYQVSVANKKVFLWPENWIEPELKKDRSQFFKDLENELLQNEINQYTVEKAFQNYLEKLDGVAQLEIAGFYQEDDGDNAVLHLFGRTTGAEPHLYYYRRYDYRQWTPWEKLELDIQSDYLIPAVVNKRLFLFWPVFTEVPDENSNKNLTTPSSNANVQLPPTWKKLRLQMAVSEYRQGNWTPKKISNDFDETLQYSVDSELIKRSYSFFPLDSSEVDGRFYIKYGGSKVVSPGVGISRAFEISGCTGVLEKIEVRRNLIFTTIPEVASRNYFPVLQKWEELTTRSDFPENDFTLENLLNPQFYTRILAETPGIFKITPPWHLSYLDKFWLDARVPSGSQSTSPDFNLYVQMIDNNYVPVGIWLPFFYNDKKRTFFVLPSLRRKGTTGGIVRSYYPEIKTDFRGLEASFEGQVKAWLDSMNLSALSPAQKQQIEQSIWQEMNGENPPPYSDEQIKELMKRYLMRFIHFYLGTLPSTFFPFIEYHFKNYYHPFVCDFAKLVNNPLKGISALMKRETQLKNTGFRFKQIYQPTSRVVEAGTEKFYPKEEVDFTPDGAYSVYNWELFFHAPLLIANALSKNQRFDEAREWYHFIFNPIGVESYSPQQPGDSLLRKYWITKPFFETTDQQYIQQRIDNILRMLAGDTSVPGYSEQAKKDLEDQVLDWRTNPFEPHRIANYRTVAYQKTVVMKYLDNLIAWGDYLFGQDSMESINEATQLYVLAAEILGPRPRKIPQQAKPPVKSFNEIEEEIDSFANALIQVENLIPVVSSNGSTTTNPAPLPLLYFCIPQNDKMLSYWDTVADRLYKIRHCMNIEGVVRQLALFEPPIEPGALVKAVAGGIDVGSALADLNAPLPLYRFNILLQKANEVCNDVKSLGSALLSALEKKDAEALGILRQTHESRLLDAVKTVREKQVDEAKDNLEGTKKSKELAEIKKKYYESREFMSAGETTANTLSWLSTSIEAAIALGYILSGGLKVVPQFILGAAGFGGTPHATAETGGKTFGEIAEDAALTLSAVSRALEKGATIASTMAGYERRKDDWDFQKDLAVKELEQIDKSIAAADLRKSIAEKELDNHQIQIDNAKAVDDFMHSKYTNEELYQWHIGQIAAVYFQSYKLAYDLAKRAERAFRFELGLQDSSYINFGYWDSLKKGLLAGEKLQYDLRRLETAYLEQNRREFELTKHISLALLDPLALVKLRETGRCFVHLPEEIFDLDYPGHYIRRIKSVSLTLPCVTGPYTTVSCTFRLLKNSIRINTSNGANGYPRNTDDQGLPAIDDRFVENNIPVKAIAASNAQNDSGVFELSFRDERYLPFEGAGAISEWSLELFNDLPSNNPDPKKPDFGTPLRQFDYNTISDVILHIKYTAREDAGAFKNSAVTHVRDYFSLDGTTPSLRMFNLRQEFPTQWHRFLNPTDSTKGNVFELEMSSSLFPMRDQGKTLKVNTVWMIARCTNSGNYDVVITPPLPAPPAGSNTMTLSKSAQLGGLHYAAKGKQVTPPEVPLFDAAVDLSAASTTKWHLKVTRPGGGNLQANEVSDLILILGYEW